MSYFQEWVKMLKDCLVGGEVMAQYGRIENLQRVGSGEDAFVLTSGNSSPKCVSGGLSVETNR